MVEIKVAELLVDELVNKRKLDLKIVRNLRSLSQIESVSDLRRILENESIPNTIDLEGFYKILAGFIIQQFSNFFNGYTDSTWIRCLNQQP
jgi:hypothetical protein